MFKTMKVLITGAKGMLGQTVLDVFADHDVVGVDLPEMDITHPQDISRTLELYRPTAVINCAAFTAVDDCETKEDLANRVNGTAVGYLAKATEVQKIPLVHISTDYVFGGTNPDGYAEDYPAGPPSNAYGRTKLHGEEQLRQHAKRHYLVRTSWLYGVGGPAAGSGGPKNFVQTMLSLAKTKSELKVVNDQHGKPTHTRDLAGFIKSLLTTHAPYGIYHGVNEEVTTWFDFTNEIFRQTGITTTVTPCASSEFPRPAKRPEWSVLLNTKRPPLRPWSEALRDYLQEIGYGVQS